MNVYLKSLFCLCLMGQSILLPAREADPLIRLSYKIPGDLKVGECFKISYQTNVMPEQFIEPDLSSFIVKVPRQVEEISMTYTMPTGKKETYTYSFTYQLEGTEPGKYEIPAAEMIYRGETYKSKSAEVVIHAHMPFEEIKDTISIRPVWPGHFLLEVSFNTRADESPVFEWPDGISFLHDSFGSSQTYEMLSSKRISSYYYTFLIKPEASGIYTIPATKIKFNGQEYPLNPYVFEIDLDLPVEDP